MCPRAALWSRMAIGTWANSHIIQLSNSMIFNAETITAVSYTHLTLPTTPYV